MPGERSKYEFDSDRPGTTAPGIHSRPPASPLEPRYSEVERFLGSPDGTAPRSSPGQATAEIRAGLLSSPSPPPPPPTEELKDAPSEEKTPGWWASEHGLVGPDVHIIPHPMHPMLPGTDRSLMMPLHQAPPIYYTSPANVPLGVLCGTQVPAAGQGARPAGWYEELPPPPPPLPPPTSGMGPHIVTGSNVHDRRAPQLTPRSQKETCHQARAAFRAAQQVEYSERQFESRAGMEPTTAVAATSGPWVDRGELSEPLAKEGWWVNRAQPCRTTAAGCRAVRRAASIAARHAMNTRPPLSGDSGLSLINNPRSTEYDPAGRTSHSMKGFVRSVDEIQGVDKWCEKQRLGREKRQAKEDQLASKDPQVEPSVVHDKDWNDDCTIETPVGGFRVTQDVLKDDPDLIPERAKTTHRPGNVNCDFTPAKQLYGTNAVALTGGYSTPN